MTDNRKDRIAVLMLTLLPFYHKKIFRMGQGISGMQITRCKVLWILTREGTLPMSDVGKLLGLSKPYMTTLVDHLISDGYAERNPDSLDRRVINISITPAGRKHLQRAGEKFKAEIKSVLTGLDDADLGELCQSLEKLHSIFAKIS